MATFGFIVISASGIGHALLHPVEDDSGQLALVVASLVDGGATLDVVPEGFEQELGYRPVVAAGALVNPKGACSTPGGVGPDSFTDACRVHDFGYDILRYAEGTGTRVGPLARFDLDRRLYADLLSTCDTVTCEATATVYYTAVTLNSIRQGYVAPTEEPTVPWAITAVGVVGLATAPTRRHKWKQPPIDAFGCRVSRSPFVCRPATFIRSLVSSSPVNFRRSVPGATVPFRLFMVGGAWPALVALAGAWRPSA